MSTVTVLPERLQKIPPFPAVAARVLVLLSQPTPEIGNVAELITSDPTLAARVLKCVNSYEYGVKADVTNIRQAIALIGLNRTRQITTTAATAIYLKRLMTAELLRCWHHSIATAVLCEEIARSCGTLMNLAYVAGIMHDLGRLGLLVAYPDEYARLIRNAEENSLELLEVEEQKFGINHAEAGRILTEAWNLPEEFRVINGRHHDPCNGSEFDLLSLVHISCRLANSLGFAVVSRTQPAPEAIVDELPRHARANMQKTREELCALIEERISTVT